MATGESSTEEELSREFSTLSTSSSVTSSISRKSNASTIKGEQNDGDEDLSRHGTAMSDESTSSRPTSGLSSVATTSRQNTVGSIRSENSSRHSERSLSRGSTIRNDDEETKNDSVSRESSVVSSQNGYDDDFHDDEESSPSSASSRQQSFVGKSPSNENSDDSEDEGNGKMEKENSVLIEKDGKFELVEERDLTIDQREALGLTKREKQKPNTLNIPASSGRVRKSSNPEYAHLKSEYGMSDQQKEMKSRRVSVMQMRRQEERKRIRQEEEEKKKAADKSFKVTSTFLDIDFFVHFSCLC